MPLSVKNARLPVTWSVGISSQLGPLTLWASMAGLVRLELAQELNHAEPPANVRRCLSDGKAQLIEYLQGRRQTFDLALDWSGTTDFSQRVWNATSQIPYGQVVSYSSLAFEIGSQGAQRAVGHALGSNPLPIIVPCHRVLRSDGGLGGFRLGLAIKSSLLALEGYTI